MQFRLCFGAYGARSPHWTLWHRWGQGSRCAGKTWAVAHVRLVLALGSGSVGASSALSRALSASFRTSSSTASNFRHRPRNSIRRPAIRCHPLLSALGPFSHSPFVVVPWALFLAPSCSTLVFLKAELFGRISGQAACFFRKLHLIFVLVMVS